MAKKQQPSLTQRLVEHLGRVTFALTAVVATEPDASLLPDQEAERQRQRQERAPKREAMMPAVQRLIADGNDLAAEHERRGRR